MYDLVETELYHEVGPNTVAVDGEATGTAETSVSVHDEVDRDTLPHVYQYLESNPSHLTGACTLSQRPPATSHEESTLHKVSWESLVRDFSRTRLNN